MTPRLMNVLQAVNAMLMGEHVRRLNWPGRQALYFDPTAAPGERCGFRSHDGALGTIRGTFSDRHWPLTPEDLLAFDWHVTD